VRLVVAALLVGFVVAGMGDGWWSSPSAEPVVQDFLLDWQQQSYAAAATWTTGQPTAVATALKDAYRQLDAASFFLSMGHIQQHGKTATASFSANVDLGQNGLGSASCGPGVLPPYELTAAPASWTVRLAPLPGD